MSKFEDLQVAYFDMYRINKHLNQEVAILKQRLKPKELAVPPRPEMAVQTEGVFGIAEDDTKRALQENLELTDELTALRKAYKDLFDVNMHLARKVEIGLRAEVPRGPNITLSGNETVEVDTVGSISRTRIRPQEKR